MLRTVLSLGFFALLGLAALKLFFGVFVGVFGVLLKLFFWLLGVALLIAFVGLAIYLVISVVSPETARRLRERFSGQM